MIILFFILLF